MSLLTKIPTPHRISVGEDMYSGILELYKNTIAYCQYKIAYDNCKWWEFSNKKQMRLAMDYYYPLMICEIKLSPNESTPQ